MTPKTRETALNACRAALDTIRNDIAMNGDYYAKGDWRGDLHRRQVVRDIVDLRVAIRELRPPRFSAWMARPENALLARMVDPR